MAAILANNIERGMLLVNPHNKPAYVHKGTHFLPHMSVMKITKYKIMLDDYSCVPKTDTEGKVLTYELAD